MKKQIALMTVLLALIACSKSETRPEQTAARSGTSLAAPAATVAQEVPVSGKSAIAEMGGAVLQRVEKDELRGTVVEALPTSGFTYARLKTSAGDEWVVMDGSTRVAKGDAVVVRARMVAEKFPSTSLKRTFKKVTFADLVSGGKKVPVNAGAGQVKLAAVTPGMQMPAGHPPVDGKAPAGMTMPSPHGTAAAGADTTPIRVQKASAVDAKTVAEIWAGRALLGDASVTVRGKVVKSLNGIMGKNWLHLRDGSGSAAAGDDDITITTTASVKPGEIVTMKGVVRVDKDFGAGYKYAVIVEEGTIVK